MLCHVQDPVGSHGSRPHTCCVPLQVHEVARNARNPERVFSAASLPEDASTWTHTLARAQWWWTCHLRKPTLRCVWQGPCRCFEPGAQCTLLFTPCPAYHTLPCFSHPALHSYLPCFSYLPCLSHTAVVPPPSQCAVAAVLAAAAHHPRSRSHHRAPLAHHTQLLSPGSRAAAVWAGTCAAAGVCGACLLVSDGLLRALPGGAV